MIVKLTAKDKIKVQYPADIYAVMRRTLLAENYIDRYKEHFWIVGLNSARKIIFIELVSLGSTTTAPTEPMQVFRVAVLKGASSVILVHNHPSGELEPSVGDTYVTERLSACGKILGISVTDHIIISEDSYYSFTKAGIFESIEDSV